MKTQKRKNKTQAEAMKLVRDPRFLHLAMTKIGELGVVGEERNRLFILLAGLTKDFDEPVSVLIKGTTSSGKSYLMRKVIQLFPPEWVVTRASLSGKAIVHMKESMAGRILYLYEYRGGKDAQLLLRLLQSEHSIAHEYATVVGKKRGTDVAVKGGALQVFTTTTDEKPYPDDVTRSTILNPDESPEQTLAIVRAQARNARTAKDNHLAPWHEAFRLICKDRVTFTYPPWFEYVATSLPVSQGRLRRDWSRFLNLCQAVALSRRFVDGHEKDNELVIDFCDYCIAYEVANSAFTCTAHGIHPLELKVADCVATFVRKSGEAVTTRQLMRHLLLTKKQVYKYVNRAVKHKLIMRQPGTRERNLKPLLPVPGASVGFLLPPSLIQRNCPDIAGTVQYVDPISGETKVLRRKNVCKRPRHDRKAK